jgi:hypothetical protein
MWRIDDAREPLDEVIPIGSDGGSPKESNTDSFESLVGWGEVEFVVSLDVAGAKSP